MSAPFVTWFDPTRECTSVWDGTSTPYLLATKDDPLQVRMGSSLTANASVQPAKAHTCRSAPSVAPLARS